jgi:uracil-DNA glycosylase
VRALKPTVCLTLGRETFMRLLGPLETILKAREEMYEKLVESRSTK